MTDPTPDVTLPVPLDTPQVSNRDYTAAVQTTLARYARQHTGLVAVPDPRHPAPPAALRKRRIRHAWVGIPASLWTGALGALTLPGLVGNWSAPVAMLAGFAGAGALAERAASRKTPTLQVPDRIAVAYRDYTTALETLRQSDAAVDLITTILDFEPRMCELRPGVGWSPDSDHPNRPEGNPAVEEFLGIAARAHALAALEQRRHRVTEQILTAHVEPVPPDYTALDVLGAEVETNTAALARDYQVDLPALTTDPDTLDEAACASEAAWEQQAAQARARHAAKRAAWEEQTSRFRAVLDTARCPDTRDPAPAGLCPCHDC